jgi:hypothetical protein
MITRKRKNIGGRLRVVSDRKGDFVAEKMNVLRTAPPRLPDSTLKEAICNPNRAPLPQSKWAA